MNTMNNFLLISLGRYSTLTLVITKLLAACYKNASCNAINLILGN